MLQGAWLVLPRLHVVSEEEGEEECRGGGVEDGRRKKTGGKI